MLTYAVEEHEGPIAVRYPRGTAPSLPVSEDISTKLNIRMPEVLTKGTDVCIFAVGKMVETALETESILRESGVHATVVNVRQVCPLPKGTLRDILSKNQTGHVVTLEDNVAEGGFGAAVSRWIGEEGLELPIQTMGIPGRFVEHGDVDTLMASLGLDSKNIAKRIQMKLKLRSRRS